MSGQDNGTPVVTSPTAPVTSSTEAENFSIEEQIKRGQEHWLGDEVQSIDSPAIRGKVYSVIYEFNGNKRLLLKPSIEEGKKVFEQEEFEIDAHMCKSLKKGAVPPFMAFEYDASLGDKVKNVLTKIKGIVTAVEIQMTGCVWFLVQPKPSKKDQKLGRAPGAIAMHADQVEVIEKAVAKPANLFAGLQRFIPKTTEVATSTPTSTPPMRDMSKVGKTGQGPATTVRRMNYSRSIDHI